jgi:hypothetical protein
MSPATFVINPSGRIEVMLEKHLVGVIEPWHGGQIRNGMGHIEAYYWITLPVDGGNGRKYPVSSVSFGPVIGIAGTRREPHDLAASVWGGKVSRYVPKNPHHLPQFQWSRYGAAAIGAINDVYPFLRIKSDQADVVLELWALLEDRRLTKEDPFPWFGPDFDPAEQASRLADECAALNQWRRRLGKKAAGRLLDGREWNEMPEKR